jgi:hypothetical protein
MSWAALRRRWWVVLLCVLGVAAIAYAVGELRARTSTAEAVVLLNPGVITSGPGAADQAARLAADYARAIPQDDDLLSAVSRRLGSPAGGHVVAANRPGSALLDVGFRAHDRAAAVTGALTTAQALTAASPPTPTIAQGSLSTIRLPTRARKVADGYEATAVLLTRAGGTPVGPGYADQANKLAPSFAASISTDAGILRFVARRLGVSVNEVEDHTTVKNEKDTAILRLQYKAHGDAAAERGARALAAAVTGPTPASPTMTPQEFTLVRVEQATSPSSNPAVTLPIGAVLGLCLGLVLLLALERANPRVDDPAFLEEELRCPVYEVDEITPSTAGAFVERWRVLGKGERPTVALVPASSDLKRATAALADRLATEAGRSESELIGGAVRLTISSSPADDPAGASLAAASDVAVLVVARGQPLADVRAARHALDTFEVPVQWGLLLTPSARSRLARHVPGGDDRVGGRTPPARTAA